MNYIDEIFEKSNKLKYAKWYKQLCENAQSRIIEEGVYYERHHIIPKNVGGNNSRKNLVRLTGREHYIAHLLLTRMFNSANYKIKMLAAFGGFISQNRNNARKLTSRQIEIARKAKSDAQKGKKFTEEHKKRIGDAHRGKPKSAEHILNNSLSHKGNRLSQESLDKGVLTKRNNREKLKLENPELYAIKRFNRISSTSGGHVFIDGTEYPSIGEAAKSIGRNPDYVEMRVKSDNYPNWIFVPRVKSLKNV